MVTTKELTKGQVVLYSDLSPWELATVVQVHNESNEVTLLFNEYENEEPLRVAVDGIRTINWSDRDKAAQRITQVESLLN